MVVHKRKLSFLGTILFGLALSTFPVNAQEVSSSEQPFENQVSSVQSASVSSVSSTVESSASSVSSSSKSASEPNTVSSGSSSASGNASSDVGGTTSSKESLQTVAPPVSDGWKTESGGVYYYKNGQKQKGWLQLNGKKYYLDSQTGVRKTKELFQTEKGFSYAQADGTILSGGKKKGDDGNLYLVSSDGILRNSGLLVTPDYDGYWAPYYIDAQTHAVKTGLFNVNGTYYYGREDKGYLVCGKYKAPDGKTYLANSNGTLRNSGLLVTPDYDGYWAPYYIDAQTHAVKIGFFNVNGTYYYGREDKGYLVCGKYKAPDGKTYLANSNGTLRNAGLLITPDYDGYWAPYYIDAQTHAVKIGFFNVNGTYYYGREDKGYLVCGKYKAPDGKTYLANSNGTLRNPGLLITPDYDGYWAPYYIDAQTHAVKIGFFSVNGTYYYGREDKGYLVCGKYKAPDGKTYLANSNGTLRNPGLLITPDYDGYWAPYYIDAQTHAVKIGFFNVNGTYYYGREDKGYLVCGKYKAPDGKTYLANSNGTLRNPGLLITPDYDGYWAPYYIDAQTHAVKTGFFSVNGTYYYGREDKGYLVCGKYKAPDGHFYLANSDGTLKASGWVSTSDYDGSLQIYYIDADTHAVKTGLFMVDEKNYYGREDYGYIVRGTYTNPHGDVYTSSDNGVLNDKMLGVDVSKYQGVIDWNKVKNTGISFAIIQAGYGDSATQIDPYFIQNIKGALAAGIKVGSYWFSYATSVEDAKLEASVFANALSPYKDRLTFPAFYDFEYASYNYYQKMNKVEPTKENITDMAVAFIEAMKSMGYIAGNYTNLDYYRNYFDYSKLQQYPMWYAQYQVASPDVKTSLWQYSSKGTIDGINGDTDLDRYNIAGLPESTKTGICTAADGSVNVRRTAPNGDPVGQISPNEEVVVLDQQLVNGAVWYQIRKTDGTVGWVYGEYLKVQ
ncbi:putative Lysozyme [Ruminococcaceae bacterium BL-4]|nr:putative Lysozyme [Ruminococcaceae bacterium BL-4]